MEENKINLQTLVVTVNCDDEKALCQKMNIQTPALVGNQNKKNETYELDAPNGKITVFCTDTLGVGKNRNIVLKNAASEILLFSDDDVIYYDGYGEKIIKAFENSPDADVMIFDIECKNGALSFLTKKKKRIRIFNCLRYGMPRIAFRADFVKKHKIEFSEEFGGGTKYSAGEDSLFLSDMIRAGAKVYAVPVVIGKIENSKSSWFDGYTDKFFMDKGVFFYKFSKKHVRFLCMQYCLRRGYTFRKEVSGYKAYKLMMKGAKLHSNGLY